MWWTLALVLVGCGAMLCVLIVMQMAYALLHPPKMTDGRALTVLGRLTPEDLNLRYENVDFQVRDERSGAQMRIAGWWMPHREARGRCVLLVHGYSDAKVGAIAWAPLLHSLGLNILAVDLRYHGESDGRHITAGYFERHDLNQVIDQWRAAQPEETRTLVLFGISLGAAAVAAAAALREDLAAVVLESPYASFRSAAMQHGELFGAPGKPLQRVALRVAEWYSGADFDAVRPVDLIGKIRCPLLVIHAGDDPLLTPADAVALEEAMKGRGDFGTTSTFWRVADAGHVLAMANDPAEYHRGVKRFLETAGVLAET